MTIIDAINRINKLVPNTFEEREKIFFLSTLDANVKENVIDRHEGFEKVSFTGYDDNTETTTVLLVPSPYDEIYLFWLEMKICYYNQDMDQYNNATVMFNKAYDKYCKFYNRTHKPRKEHRGFHF